MLVSDNMSVLDILIVVTDKEIENGGTFFAGLLLFVLIAYVIWKH